MLTTSRTGVFDRREPIPGYKTVELIGRGGCGEVWRAVAPGGLSKAVKIVYGDVDAETAIAEKRALARIKDVRHPMLLSIERIEVVEGNLVIVMELAEESLKDLFLRFRAENSCGIAQDQLLGILGDTADALDFLYEKHSLQHLDVKPENVLIVGGRAKVGDFGLVKSLYERSASIIGGLTPTYAPPELFEGRPTRYSDQYSLAIVYMHMLTGSLPFTASNTAQMAEQHLRGVPDLLALPKQQRPVIARALSKEPGQRFDNCRGLVDALRESARDTDRIPDKSAAKSSRDDHSAQSAKPSGTPGGASYSNRPFDLQKTDTTKRPQQQAETRRPTSPAQPWTEATPTIFIGLGGAGVDILSKLMQRLTDFYGDVDSWPAVEFLAVDSETRNASRNFDESCRVRTQVLPVPLRTTESYAPQTMELLKWLGRRWMYNIPRNLNPNGYRPLGRLALLTHARQVRQSIERSIDGVLESSREVAAKLNLQAANGRDLRVVVIASSAGGTGGGSLIDVSYAVRSELKRRGLSDENVHGVILHSTARGPADRDKARASTFATLQELNHFSRSGSYYPGEPRLAAAPFHGDNATFCQTHFFNLGENLNDGEWHLATEQLAEFVYSLMLTPAGATIHSNLRSAPPDDGVPRAHVYEVLGLGAGSSRIIDQAVRTACLDAVRLWRTGTEADEDNSATVSQGGTVKMRAFALPAASRGADVDSAVAAKLAEHRIDYESFLKEVNEALVMEVGSDTNTYLESFVREATEKTRAVSKGVSRVDAIVAMIDRLLTSASDKNRGLVAQDSLYDQILTRMIARLRPRSEKVLQWMRELVDLRDVRVEWARRHAASVRRSLQDLRQKLLVHAGDLHEAGMALALEARNHSQSLDSKRPRFFGWAFGANHEKDEGLKLLFAFARTRLNEVAHRALAVLVDHVEADIEELMESMDSLIRALDLLGQEIEKDGQVPADLGEQPGGANAQAIARYRAHLEAMLTVGRQEIADRICSEVEKRISTNGFSLGRLLNPNAEVRGVLMGPLRETARQIIVESIRQVSQSLTDNDGTSGNSQSSLSLIDLLSGGSRGDASAAREVLIVPNESISPTFQRRLQGALPGVTIVPCTKSDITLCRVLGTEPLANLADRVIAGIDLYRDLAARLHTRTDIGWMPMPVVASPSAPTHDPQDDSEGAEDVTHTVAIRQHA